MGSSRVSPMYTNFFLMKSASINLTEDRQQKLQALVEAAPCYTAEVEIAGKTIRTSERKISASALAQSLLDGAIDEHFSRL